MQQRVNYLTELTIDNHSCNLYTCTCSGGYPAEFPLLLTMERKRFKMLLKLIIHVELTCSLCQSPISFSFSPLMV